MRKLSCQDCGSKEDLTDHHIEIMVGVKIEIPLCKKCHKKRHKKRKGVEHPI